MASTYSPLKIELITTGEQSATWGTTTNVNLGTAIEEAITGSADVTFASANVTLTLTNTNGTQTARNLRLRLTGVTAGARNLIVPNIEKQYIVQNDTADTITIKNTAGTGVAIPTSMSALVFNDGTNIASVSIYSTSIVTPLLAATDAAFVNALPVVSGGTGVTTSTGSGANVLATSPTLVTPLLGTPTSGVLTNATGLPLSTGITGTLGVSNGGTGVTTSTGSGANVLATSPTLVTPALGTPSALVGTNITGTAAGLTAGNVTTNANLTGEVTSVGNAATVPNATVIGKVLTGHLSGAGTVAATDNILQAIQKLNGNNATNANLTGPITSVGNATSVAAQTGTGSTFVMNTSPTLVTPLLGTPTSGTLTNCTFPTLNQNTTGTAAGLSVTLAVASGGTGVTTSTGSGNTVLSTSPTLVSPLLGTPTSGTLTNCTFPTLNQNTTGTAAGLSATLAVGSGGTGLTTLTANNLLIGNGTSSPTFVAPSTSGNTLASNGTAFISLNHPAFNAYANATQAVTSGVSTKVAINTEVFDTNNNFDPTTNYRFTPTIAGYYQVNFLVRFAALTITGFVAECYKNGAATVKGSELASASSIGTIASSAGNGVIYMNGSTDYIELYGYIVGTGTVFNFVDAVSTSAMSAVLVRGA